MPRFCTLLILLLATRLSAQSNLPDLRVQNAGGTMVVIHEVRLLRVEPDGIRVLHSAGSAKVPYELLPDEVQAKYGFNADKAKEHREVVTAAQQTAAAAAAAVVAEKGSFPTPTLSSASHTPSSPTFIPSSASYNPSTSSYNPLSMRGSTRTYSSSRYRSRYYGYSPSCTAYSPCGYSYSSSYPVYYYIPGSSCGSTATSSSGTMSVGR